MDTREVEAAVAAIAQDIYDTTGGVEYFDLILSTDGRMSMVDFIGIRLWSSEDDDREYTGEDDERVPIEYHLRSRLNEELLKLRLISVWGG